MPKRKAISREVQAQVLDSCRRRCCICCALDSDGGEKAGQIAHLDHNRSNNRLENLVWLCLEHHDRYDSRTSQSKGLTELEVSRYRSELHEAVSSGRMPSTVEPDVFRFVDYLPGANSVNVSGNGNLVSGGDMHVTVKMPSKRGKRLEQPIIPGTVAEDARMIGYLKYLAKRYNEFKKWDCKKNGGQMKYPLIYKSYEREMHYSIANTPRELFNEASMYLQKRIQNTKLGKIKSKKQKLFQPFLSFDDRTQPDEDL